MVIPTIPKPQRLRVGNRWGLGIVVCACWRVRLLDARPHERLHKLPLEQQKRHQQRAGGHKRCSGDDCPIHALFRSREYLQADGQRAGIDELVTMSGQRKLFQWVLMETSA